MNNELYDLTNPQKSIWMTEQFYKGTSISIVAGTISLDFKLDFDLLEKSINTFIEHNDALRLQIKLVNNTPKQYIADFSFRKINIIDATDKENLDSIVEPIVCEPLELINSPLCKFIMFRYPNGHGGFIALANHMVSDAWSSSLVISGIVDIYAKLANNEDLLLNYPSYLDYIETEKKYKQSNKYLSDKEYWENKYLSLPTAASFTNFFNSSKSKIDASWAQRESFSVPTKETAKIMDFCSRYRISPFTFFLLIYGIYLGRICKLDVLNIGTPILNRVNPREKKSVGMFVNTLPFQISIHKDKSFLDCAKLLAIDELTVFRHQKYPYMELLEYLRSKFHSDNGLYDFILSYQNAKSTSDTAELESYTDWNFNHNISESLNVHIADMNDTKSFNIFYDYQIAKFSAEEIREIHNRILYLIDQVISNPNANVSEYEIVSKEELHNILNVFNNTDANFPNKTVTDLFEEQVSKTPNNIALKINNEEISYRDLNILANKFAHSLRQLGVKQNVPVALRLNKSINMIVAILGIIKAGGCYLPIDLSYPKERIDFMLKDSGCKLFITNSLHISDIQIASDIQIINMDNTDSFSDNTENLVSITTPNDNIYIIYTSGSTGTPKGVVLSHLNVVRLLKNDKFLFDFNENDVWTMFHSVAFDFSVWEMYGALLYGGKLILVPEEIAKNPFSFLKLLREENVTVLNQTPTFFYNLLDAELLRQDSDLKVRYIIFGGEALKPNLTKPWKDKYSFTKLINMYGITETTVHVTFKELTSKDLKTSDSIIGKPIPTLKVYIMDENQKLMPYGIEGEICVGGYGVCKGYLNRPELNSSRFVPNPYNKEELLYRSADSGYLTSDNTLHYIGRIDNQVKIRGFRIELGEIEAKLLKNKAIKKCVVLPHKNDKDSFLVAYIVCKQNISSSELKNYMRKLVPAYMVPNYFIKVDTLPLTSNGKVDRKKLAALPINTERDVEYVAPTTDFEKTLTRIIEANLNVSPIGINDDIINLGADSLSLMKITIALLEKGISLNIQNFYEYRTISNIEKNIDISLKNIENSSEYIYNNFEETLPETKRPVKNILLTGSTGFLGIHILRDLIKNTNANVFCLIREKGSMSSKNRLLNKLHKYFSISLDKYIGNRIQVIQGDITKTCFGFSDEEYSYFASTIDTVIHSAAIVSHYGSKSVFEEINTLGTKNVVDFCENNNIYLNHISTLSVSGNFVNNSHIDETFNEHSIYIGQDVSSNVYVKTKLDAEMVVNSAISRGLKASIYRLGNITARVKDYKFQDNYKENAFLARIISLIKLQLFPKSLLDLEFDLSPVDLCSNFIINLLQYEDSYDKIFHISNYNTIKFATLIDWLKSYNYNIEVVDDAIFNKKLLELKEKNQVLLGLINDITSNLILDAKTIDVDSTYTKNVLEKHNLIWNVPDKNYFFKFIEKFL